MTSPTLATFQLRDGAGVPLVLLHGFPLDHRMWAAMVDELPPGPRIVAVDLPGHGHSDLGHLPPSLDAAADLVHTTLRGQGEGHAVVVGLSMGGYVALALAERHPEFVRGLGLVDTKSTADDDEVREVRQQVAAAVTSSQNLDAVIGMAAKLLGPTSERERRVHYPAVYEWIRSQSVAGVAWAQRAMAARPDRTAVLRSFTGPVAVVVGDEDRITPEEDAQHMVDAAVDATLTVVPGAAHLSALEEPAVVAKALVDLYGRVHRP
ncbi:alpha/beta fold hydrolase [Isoptericola halotolerans]|uniref:Pimeloyl-ACP methyl ester carboxylesterase n=1 Tax=Isoptericola halotolerans TaxID=300560 RepID=A0ABX2A4E3_9MICO|nr:alpha/beta fold hydrolase [Isoptericola halotolerans]NOV97724.1 pimeloyl-ACP methyl ester carboxylesterase [Isoptericola halotolerans]